VGVRSVELELRGQLGKQKDLYGGTRSVPPWSRYAISISNCARLKLLTLRSVPEIHICNERVLTSVAAHVQAETMPEAIRPGLTLREAEVNSSEFLGDTPVYRA
jgi:hypothetical protein